MRDRRRGRLRVPVGGIDRQVHAVIDAHRDRLPDLLVGLRRTEAQHRGAAAVLGDDANGLLDRALVVRAHREAQVAGVDLERVVGQVDPRPPGPAPA